MPITRKDIQAENQKLMAMNTALVMENKKLKELIGLYERYFCLMNKSPLLKNDEGWTTITQKGIQK